MQQEIFNALEAALRELGASDVDFVVERPADFSHGDYATNAALVAAKMLGKNPKEVAWQLQEKLLSEKSSGRLSAQSGAGGFQTFPQEVSPFASAIEKIEIAGPGFINFFLSREAIVKEIEKAATDEKWGKNDLYAGKTVLVEYTSPNLFKPLHIGNLVGNVLGESLARVLAASGASIKKINYPSDIGLTVAKGVWGLQQLGLDPRKVEDLGRAYVAGNEAYESGEAKAAIEEINRALYDGSNVGWSELRRVGVETSRKHLDDLCAVLGTIFDDEFFESQAGPVGTELVRVHEGTVFEKSDGAVVYRGESEGLHTRVFLNSQGLPTYEAKDLGLLKLKLDTYPQFDISITDTGPEQKDYFKVLFVVAKKVLPQLADKTLVHTAHSNLILTTGKMSSRKGNVITGESLLVDLEDAAKEKMGSRELKDAEKIAEQVAVGAIKYAVLKQGSGRDIIFDPEKSLSLEGDSGPYLQYARVRALSLLRKNPKPEDSMLEITEHKSPMPLARIILHYPEVAARAAEELEPHYVTTYLTELAGAFNTWYAADRLIVEGKILASDLLLIKAFKNTMSHGLELLGIPAPEEM